MTDQPLLHTLLTRLIADGAHYARASRQAKSEAVAHVHDGIVSEAHTAAVYVADLLVAGRMREPGYGRKAEDVAAEAAARRVVDALLADPDQRERVISGAIYGKPDGGKSEQSVQYEQTTGHRADCPAGFAGVCLCGDQERWPGGRHTVMGPAGTTGEDPPEPEYEPEPVSEQRREAS